MIEITTRRYSPTYDLEVIVKRFPGTYFVEDEVWADFPETNEGLNLRRRFWEQIFKILFCYADKGFPFRKIYFLYTEPKKMPPEWTYSWGETLFRQCARRLGITISPKIVSSRQVGVVAHETMLWSQHRNSLESGTIKLSVEEEQKDLISERATVPFIHDSFQDNALARHPYLMYVPLDSIERIVF